MNVIVILIILILLFGGGGFFAGAHQGWPGGAAGYGGSVLGIIVLVLVVFWLFGRL